MASRMTQCGKEVVIVDHGSNGHHSAVKRPPRCGVATNVKFFESPFFSFNIPNPKEPSYENSEIGRRSSGD